MTELVSEALSKLSDKNLTKDEKKHFIENVALDNIDIDAGSLYIGRTRKTKTRHKRLSNCF